MKQQQSDKQAEGKKTGWRRIVVSFVIVMLLITGAAWIAYDRMTDKLLEVLMDESMADLSSNSATRGGAAADSEGPSKEPLPTSVTSSEKLPDSSKKTAEDTAAEQAEERSNVSIPDDGSASGDSVSGKGGGSKGVTEAGKRPNISQEEAEEAAGSVTMAEKIEIGAVLLSHWDKEELKSFRAALSGGLTIEEKRELKKKAMEVLSEEEYDRLIVIAQKYGLSQGKSYKQSEQDEFPSHNQPKE
ncbi:hypothetical protein [Paenibacillus mendelii]|uniref:Uncharacterized protein n=1 Tax=Paenibacillus mendelii TaxID=206163 RepID=A0ABV6J7S7_9BACL|nr:hypothetical protein [Paenibacillus mendelii]MCQ6560426.1 hypothetical protein [Paenibacillus mendelii]